MPLKHLLIRASIVAWIFAFAPDVHAQTSPRVTLPDLELLLAMRAPPASIVSVCQRRGIDFDPNDNTLRFLMSRGASPYLINAIRQVRPASPNIISLTPGMPFADRVATIVAPARGFQNYNVFYIDTRSFPRGGVLEIDIAVSPQSVTDGSFDLFPSNVPIAFQGRPANSLAGRYDVRKGTATRIEYRFGVGQVFAFGAEGNWGSRAGSAGTVRFRAGVHQ